MGYAFILYSADQEAFLHILAGSDWASSTLHAEAKALVNALKWLRNNILSSVCIVTNCKLLQDSITKQGTKASWVAENTIKEAIYLLDNLPQAQVKFINRDYNDAADSVAKEARIRRLHHMSSHLCQRVRKESIISNIFDENEIVDLLYYIA